MACSALSATTAFLAELRLMGFILVQAAVTRTVARLFHFSAFAMTSAFCLTRRKGFCIAHSTHVENWPLLPQRDSPNLSARIAILHGARADILINGMTWQIEFSAGCYLFRIEECATIISLGAFIKTVIVRAPVAVPIYAAAGYFV